MQKYGAVGTGMLLMESDEKLYAAYKLCGAPLQERGACCLIAVLHKLKALEGSGHVSAQGRELL